MATASLLDAVRMLRAAEPALGVKPLVTKLREQLPGEEVGAKEKIVAALTEHKSSSQEYIDNVLRIHLNDGADPKSILKYICIEG